MKKIKNNLLKNISTGLTIEEHCKNAGTAAHALLDNYFDKDRPELMHCDDGEDCYDIFNELLTYNLEALRKTRSFLKRACPKIAKEISDRIEAKREQPQEINYTYY